MKPEDKRVWEAAMQGVTPLNRSEVTPVPVPQRTRVEPVVLPDPTTLDLHGMTVHEAHKAFRLALNEAHRVGLRYFTVITGRSGEIRREFPHWAERAEDVRRADVINDGSFRVYLQRRR